MLRPLLFCLLSWLAVTVTVAEPAAPAVEPAAAFSLPQGLVKVVVIPVRDEIARPVLYILRRGLKEAITEKADVVVLDMKTPGGSLDVTFDIIEALGKYPGQTITYVDDQALSAGAFISAATQEIWFSSRGKIGAAAPVSSGGKDIDNTMKQKIVSYLKAEVRSISEGKGYRGQVISAMIDEDFELKIGDKMLKPKGELLTLTASEAMAEYGEPAAPLLGAGVAKDLEQLLTSKFGAGGYEIVRLEITWSEKLAVFLNSLSPILLGLGLVALFVEFKTPGFGVFGITGIVLLAIVFLANYVAGLSGHEAVLLFGLGVLLVIAELMFFPGTLLPALLGVVLIIGSLLWSMVDFWPNTPFVISGDLFYGPLINLGLGLLIAVVVAVALLRFMPKGWMWNRMILESAIDGVSQGEDNDSAQTLTPDGLLGREGRAATVLRPSGQVEIDGRRYEASVEVGAIERDARVVVLRRTAFGLIVRKVSE